MYHDRKYIIQPLFKLKIFLFDNIVSCQANYEFLEARILRMGGDSHTRLHQQRTQQEVINSNVPDSIPPSKDY